MAFKVDLNCDLGESFGNYKIGGDDKIIPLISSANVACGFHAGDPVVMKKTIETAKKNNIGIGAHPGFLDLMGFGRREMKISIDEAKAYVLYQLGALGAFCKSEGVKLQHVKPHGALYNMAAKDYKLSRAICGSETLKAEKDLSLKYASEVFADRAYEEDGSLVARSKEGAMIHDENEAIERVIKMIKEQKVTSITGKEIPIKADSICVHGDGEKALLFVRRIREKLESEGIIVEKLSEII